MILSRKLKKAVNPVKDYYLKEKIPNWNGFKEWHDMLRGNPPLRDYFFSGDLDALLESETRYKGFGSIFLLSYPELRLIYEKI